MESSPLSSDLSTSSKSTTQQSTTEQEICLSFDEAFKALPKFLQSDDDEHDKNELAIFLSQVSQLHKTVVGKVSASSIFNYLEHLLKPVVHTSEGVSQVDLPDQLSLHSGNIATEVACSVIRGDDLHTITISVLNVLQELTWETKAALVLTMYVMTFGDNGLNLSEESKMSINDISMFAKIKGYNHQVETSHHDNLFKVIYKLTQSIVKFENLPATYMTSNDPRVKVERTGLIVSVYWIIKIVIAAATSHIIKTSRRGNEFKSTISTLWEFSSRWTKKFEDMSNNDFLGKTLIRLQDLLKDDIDMEAYARIKRIVEQDNHSSNVEVLEALISSTHEVSPRLYDCMHKRKVDLHELEGEHVLLFISEIDNLAPEVEETKLNELIESFISDRGNKIECKILWIPIVDHSMQHTNMLKPFLEWYYLVCHTKVLKTKGEGRNFKGWYSVGDTTRISNEVKKFFRDDWNYVGEPMIVVLDAQGKVVNLNAIHMLYTFGDVGFPFTREMEAELTMKMNFYVVPEVLIKPAIVGLGQYLDWKERREVVFMYGGEEIEWIRSFISAVDEVAHDTKIKTVYVGRMHKLELVGRVMNDEKHPRHYCLSDPILLWFFWKRLDSIVHLFVQAGRIDDREHKCVQMLVNYDKSNVGWCLMIQRGRATWWSYPMHGKVMLCALRDYNFRRDSASASMFDQRRFIDYYEEHYKKIEPCWRVELPSTALINNAPPPRSMDQCTDHRLRNCTRKMEEYTTFVCYHGHHAPTPTSPGEDHHQ